MQAAVLALPPLPSWKMVQPAATARPASAADQHLSAATPPHLHQQQIPRRSQFLMVAQAHKAAARGLAAKSESAQRLNSILPTILPRLRSYFSPVLLEHHPRRRAAVQHYFLPPVRLVDLSLRLRCWRNRDEITGGRQGRRGRWVVCEQCRANHQQDNRRCGTQGAKGGTGQDVRTAHHARRQREIARRGERRQRPDQIDGGAQARQFAAQFGVGLQARFQRGAFLVAQRAVEISR